MEKLRGAAISKIKRLGKNKIGVVFGYAIFLLQLTGTHHNIGTVPANGIVVTGAVIMLNKTQQQRKESKTQH